MGQYHKAANLDKREFLFPHQLGDGLKLYEQFLNGDAPGVSSALLLLLACSNGRGGGDLPENCDADGWLYPIVGRWAGDRVAIIGDYCESGDLEGFDATTAFGDGWVNITSDVAAYIEKAADGEYRGTGWKRWHWNGELLA